MALPHPPGHLSCLSEGYCFPAAPGFKVMLFFSRSPSAQVVLLSSNRYLLFTALYWACLGGCTTFATSSLYCACSKYGFSPALHNFRRRMYTIRLGVFPSHCQVLKYCTERCLSKERRDTCFWDDPLMERRSLTPFLHEFSLCFLAWFHRVGMSQTSALRFLTSVKL